MCGSRKLQQMLAFRLPSAVESTPPATTKGWTSMVATSKHDLSIVNSAFSQEQIIKLVFSIAFSLYMNVDQRDGHLSMTHEKR